MNKYTLQPLHLQISTDHPTFFLEKCLLDQQNTIESWFHCQWEKNAPPLLSSIDLRRSNFKLAPIDTNLFPAGYNNLHPNRHSRCVQAIQHMLQHENKKNILIIAENHTRNLTYFNSLFTLADIFKKAGVNTQIGVIDDEQTTPITHTLSNNEKLTIHPIHTNNNIIQIKGFTPDMVLLNNDLSSKPHPMLQQAKNIITPDLQLGWHNRRKSTHFAHYTHIAKTFANEFDFDPWLITTYHDHCDNINFMQKQGLDELYTKTHNLFHNIREKYDQHNIKQEPFIAIKSDQGTYGMAVMMIQSAEEILQLNRKQRTRMSNTKGNQTVSRVLIQEGIHSTERWNNKTAEAVIYNIGPYVVDGFYRCHDKKNGQENLNRPGMQFNSFKSAEQTSVNRFYPYSVTARLATLATAHEATHIKQETVCSV